MNISENIRYIETSGEWKLFRNKSYRAMIQRGHTDQTYNADRPGVVYNCLEDSYEPVIEGCYIVTGAAGEMWPIPETALRKYDIEKEKITDQAQPVMTKPTDQIFCGIMIPKETAFTLEVDYGEICLLNGNRAGIPHGSGDWVLVAAREENGKFVPDLSDAGRIVNGEIFEILYQPYQA